MKHLFFFMIILAGCAGPLAGVTLKPNYHQYYSYEVYRDGRTVTKFSSIRPRYCEGPVSRIREWEDREWTVYDIKSFKGKMPEVTLANDSLQTAQGRNIRYSLSAKGEVRLSAVSLESGQWADLLEQCDVPPGEYSFLSDKVLPGNRLVIFWSDGQQHFRRWLDVDY